MRLREHLLQKLSIEPQKTKKIHLQRLSKSSRLTTRSERQKLTNVTCVAQLSVIDLTYQRLVSPFCRKDVKEFKRLKTASLLKMDLEPNELLIKKRLVQTTLY